MSPPNFGKNTTDTPPVWMSYKGGVGRFGRRPPGTWICSLLQFFNSFIDGFGRCDSNFFLKQFQTIRMLPFSTSLVLWWQKKGRSSSSTSHNDLQPPKKPSPKSRESASKSGKRFRFQTGRPSGESWCQCLAVEKFQGGFHMLASWLYSRDLNFIDVR